MAELLVKLDQPQDAEIGDWDAHRSARQELQTFIAGVDPENSRSRLQTEGLLDALDGYAAWQRGDRETTLDLLRSGWQKSTGSWRNRTIRWWLAELLVELDQPEEALAFYESAIHLTDQDPFAFFRVAQLRDKLGDREGALEAYENVALAWSGDIHPALEPFAAQARSEAARLRGLQRD